MAGSIFTMERPQPSRRLMAALRISPDVGARHGAMMNKDARDVLR
ncbi:MAG TPA: hypothetical protein VFK25_11025 [Candidatus Binatia bacterium]|nr:hypothetical protein [Candidatus Binatia bacterium]